MNQVGVKKRREMQSEMVITAGSGLEEENTDRERDKICREVGKRDKGVNERWQLSPSLSQNRGGPSPSSLTTETKDVFEICQSLLGEKKKNCLQVKMWKLKTILSNLFCKI